VKTACVQAETQTEHASQTQFQGTRVTKCCMTSTGVWNTQRV